jgi:hypothetical protein
MTYNDTQALLVRCEAAEIALAEAESVVEFKNIRDQAEALRQCAKIAGYGLEYHNWVTEIKIRAERRAGELLDDLIPSSGGRPPKKTRYDGWVFRFPNLSRVGDYLMPIPPLAAGGRVPEEIFELHVASVKARGDELMAKELQRQDHEGPSSNAKPDARRRSASSPSARLYQDEWLILWDAELEEPNFVGDNTIALVVTNGVGSRCYLLEAVRDFIVTPVRKQGDSLAARPLEIGYQCNGE